MKTCVDCGERNAECKDVCLRCYKRRIRRARGVKQQAWRGKFDRCQECGASQVVARGLCAKCWQAWRRRVAGVPYRGSQQYRGVTICRECGGKAWNRGLCRNCYARWWRKTSEQARIIEQRRENNRHFGGHIEVEQRITLGCEICGMSNDEHVKLFGVRLHVHHIDHRGMASENPNHEPSNLTVVCASCHAKIHAAERAEVSA